MCPAVSARARTLSTRNEKGPRNSNGPPHYVCLNPDGRREGRRSRVFLRLEKEIIDLFVFVKSIRYYVGARFKLMKLDLLCVII